MKRHNLPEQGVVVRFGSYKQCIDCGEKIYSEREWETSSCPGKIMNDQYPKITKMLLEDVIKTYWDGYYPIIDNQPLICKEHRCPAFSIAWLAKHMRKEHNIYIARGDTKRQLYHTKDLLPGS